MTGKEMTMELRDKNGLTEAEFLANYQSGDWPHPSVTADVLVFAKEADGLKLLLVRRGGHPCLGKWALPGGFTEPGETVEVTAQRELREETNLTGLSLVPVGFFTDPGRDPRCWSMTRAFMVLVDGVLPQAKAGDDAQETGWFTVSTRRAGEGFKLLLTRGEEKLCAHMKVREEKTAAGYVRSIDLLGQNGLAFDHGKIIVTALLKLNETVKVL
jgi:ADP-ribose pyrophosphatase YjhB (NUDIX family)